MTSEAARVLLLITLVAGCLATTNCSAPAPRKESTRTLPPLSVKNATISAYPNPIQVCDRSGYGVTSLTWSSAGSEMVEVQVNSPNGSVLSRSGAKGTISTGKWVTDGMIFYLQDVSEGRSLTPENTLAAVTVKVNTAGCP